MTVHERAEILGALERPSLPPLGVCSPCIPANEEGGPEQGSPGTRILAELCKDYFCFSSHGYYPLSLSHEVPEPAITVSDLSLYFLIFFNIF